MKILPIQFNFKKVGKFLKPSSVAPRKIQQKQDTFVKVKTEREKYLEKLYAIFPKKYLAQYYDKLNKDFGIDYPPKLTFSATNSKGIGTNYSFNENTININLHELLDKDHKIIDKRTNRTVISSFNQMPLFFSKQEAVEYVNSNLSSNYIIKPTTIKEQRKFILHKIAHEVIKAQQYMIMRQTQKIGDIGILKAKNHSEIIKRAGQLDNYATYLHSNTFWNTHQTPQTISMDCSIGRQALIWLDSIEHDLPMGTMQNDANLRAYNYIVAKSGEY